MSETFKKGSQLKELLKTSLPAAVDLSLQPLLWIYETVWIARIGTAALGGHGLAIQVILVTFTILLTFVVGSSLIINRYLGKDNKWEANHILGQSVMLGILMSVFFAVLFYYGSDYYFKILGDELAAQSAGIDYLKTISFFIPVIVTNFVALGIIRGVGDTHYSMMITLTSSVLILVIEPLLIFGRLGLPRLELVGAALAVGIAHTVALILTLILLRSRKSKLFLSFREMTTPRFESIKMLFQTGLPTTIEQLTWAFGQLLVSIWVAQIGIVALATHSILLRIQGVLTMIYWGFGMASMAQVGKKVGAEDHHLAERAAMTAGKTIALIGIVMVVLVSYNSHWLLRVFTPDRAILDLGSKVVFIFAIIQLPKALNNVVTGNMRGAGELRFLMWMMIGAVILFEVSASALVIFVLNFGLAGVWFVHGFDEAVRLLFSLYRFRQGSWKIRRV